MDITDSLPQFSIIRKILCNNTGGLCLIYQNINTIRFNENLHGFQIEIVQGLTVINLLDLFNPFPALFARLPLSGTLLVSTKFAL